MHHTTGTFLYLLGIPGCGKLTIAKEIQTQWNCILVDNHRIINVILPLVDPDGRTPIAKPVWSNVSRVRAAVLDTIRDHAKPGRNFIFTNAFRDGVPEHEEAFDDVCKLAKHRGANVLSVRLGIEPEEAARRVVGPDRVEAYKEIDEDAARQNARSMVVLRPKGVPVLELDVTHLTAETAASEILAYVRAEA